MVNLRYHVVSLVAVFLALGIGIVLGSSLGDTVVSQANKDIAASLRTDLTQAQREAEDLARMAQTVPADVTKIREGMLPKDAIEKLKQIEKLSKRLRTGLAH